MPDSRYFIPDHPSLKDVYSKDDLRKLVVMGKLTRSEIVLDDQTGMAHLLGDLITVPHHESHVVDDSEEPEKHGHGHLEFRARTPLPQPEPPFVPEEAPVDEEEFYDDAEEEIEPDDGPQEELMPIPERLVYRGRPSWFSYPKLVLTFAASVAIAVWAYREHYEMSLIVTAAALAGLAIVLIVLDRTTTEYFVTTERVEMESGVVGRNSKEIRVEDIRAIDVYQRGWLALFGVGTVEFSSSAGLEAEVSFKNVWRPHRIKERVRELQR